MADDTGYLERLVQELAALTPEDRARVVSEAAQRAHRRPASARFSVPILKGGTAWVGSELRREELYGGDGR